jgi:adenylate cyclase
MDQAAVDTSPARISADELARRLGVSATRVAELAAAGAIAGAADGTFDPGDVHRVRLLLAFEEAGVPLDALLAASRAGQISLRYYDELHPEPTPLSTRSYAAFAASLGPRRTHLMPLFTAFGIAEPEGTTILTVEEEALITEICDVVERTGHPDLALRAIRVFSDGARRSAESALSTYGEAVRRSGGDLDGFPEDELFDRLLRPWARFARVSIPMTAWLTGRHLSRAIDEYSMAESERILQESGYVETRTEAPPAVAFVDLTGFTRLTEELGDEAAASLALRLGDATVDTVRTRGGRVVKLLGDGVLVRFADAEAAVDATLALLEALPGAGLPTGHAGVASGPLIMRDGDVFGRTVNMAARISDAAPDGRLWVTEDVAAGLPRDRFLVGSPEAASLQGIGVVSLVDVGRATT